MNTLVKQYEKIKALNGDFFAIFGKRLFNYHDPIFGFDVCKFDADLGTPDGISMREYIAEKYGFQGVNLLEALIS